MNASIAAIEQDFGKRPKWLQDAAVRLLGKSSLTDADLDELTLLCKKEAGIKIEGKAAPAFRSIPAGSFQIAEAVTSLRFDSIGSIKGINALAPKKALEIGPKPLTVIYGLNGSGKSGYMRLIKYLSGTKNLPLLLGNVFEEVEVPQSCTVGYTLDGAAKTASWTRAAGAIGDLKCLSLYDTALADVYVNKENEVTFEPSLLKIFRLLVEACTRVEAALRKEITAKVSALPQMPVAFAATPAMTWYRQLSHTSTAAIIAANCAWSPEKEAELTTLVQRIGEDKPLEKAKGLRKAQTHAIALRDKLNSVRELVSDASFANLEIAKKDAKLKRQAVNDAANIFANGLKGVMTTSWKQMWEKARLYSEGAAYPDKTFPHLTEAAKCVLCQQELSTEAQKRMGAFEAFVKGSLEADAAKAEKAIEDILGALKDSVTQGLENHLDLAQISDAPHRTAIQDFCTALEARKTAFGQAADIKMLPPLPADILPILTVAADATGAKALVFETDAKSDKKAEMRKTHDELSARKWLSQQKAAVEAELKRLVEVQALEECCRKTNTKWLSTSKDSLAETIITEAFIAQFEKELGLLGADKIRVAIEKTRAQKGQVFHQLKLKDSKRAAKAADILSEGQFRIVSIAAFLADVELRAGNTPFIFDDPISSLDQTFEEATAARLVLLAKTRQVIVFTHRLSMLSIIEDAAEQGGVELTQIAVTETGSGPGEPDLMLLADQKPDAAIRMLGQARLAAAKTAFKDLPKSDYDPIAQALCSDIRKTLERLIESNLLNGIVQRFRRGVQTLRGLDQLAKIGPADCKFFDELMTKYSRFEHSHSSEAPVAMPAPSEIEMDLKAIDTWCTEFKKRAIPK